MRLRCGETVPALFPRTDSEFALRNWDHLRRPRCALGRSAPSLPRGSSNASLRVRRSSRGKAHRLLPVSPSDLGKTIANLSTFSANLPNSPSRKDIELSPSGLPRRGSSLQKLKDFASPCQRCSHRTLFPLAPLRQAALRSIPQRAITAVRSESSSLNLNDSLGERSESILA